MKKQLMTITLIVGLALMTGASTSWAKGQRGYANCPQMTGPMMQQLDKATQDKLRQFFKDTLPQHREMAMKRAERQALMSSATPDPQAVARVTGEIFDLRVALQEKAEQAGVAQYMGPGCMSGMGFMGRNGGRMGRHMDRMGMGNYWQGTGMGPGMGMAPAYPPVNDDDDSPQPDAE